MSTNDKNKQVRDFSVYEFNNWKKHNNNKILNEIEEKGGSIWLNVKGELVYKLSKDSPVNIIKNIKQANLVFTNYLNKEVFLLKEGDKDSNCVSVKDLLMVQSEEFNPNILKEFFKRNMLHYRNLFKPTKYLQMNKQESENFNIEQFAIYQLLNHLVNYNNVRLEYFINWLAYFFQGLKKSMVSLVLRGDQGAGKGVLFNDIITPLFGEEYCTTINDKSLRSAYLGGIVENKIFFNLDEVSQQKAQSTSIKNFLKALVTNKSITAEKKFVTTQNETKIYGQVLITSNEPHVLDIEDSDRRYTVLTTGGNLLHSNYLGYGSYDKLSMAIEQELPRFASYLKSYKIDKKIANKAVDTPEKNELKQMRRNREFEKQQRLNNHMPRLNTPKIHNAIINFADAIRFRNINNFSIIRYDDEPLFQDINNDLQKNIFKIKNLLPVYKLLYGNELTIRYVSILLKELAKYDPMQFNFSNYKQYEDENGERIDYLEIIPFVHSYQQLKSYY